MRILTVIAVCGLLAGCLAIYPPVFARQSPDSSMIAEQPGRRAGDERAPLLSLGAILLGLCLLGGLRGYQHAQLINNPQRAQAMRRKLLAQIAGLDDGYALGRIRKHDYLRTREHLKQRVLDITLRQYS